MKNIGFVLCLLLIASPLQAEIYKWTDSNGNVSFSDKPQPGAEEITLPKVQTYSAPKQAVAETPIEPAIDIERMPYKKFDIISPLDQITIRNAQRTVSVQLQLTPKLKKGDKVQIIADGSPTGKPLATLAFVLQNINRGSHSISAEVIDEKGRVQKTSNTIFIYMMPPRVGMGKGSP